MIDLLTQWLHFIERLMTSENAVVTAVLSWVFAFALLQFIKAAVDPFDWRRSYGFRLFLSFGAVLFTYAFIAIGGGIDFWFWKIGLSLGQPLAYKGMRWYFRRKGWDWLETGYVLGSAAPTPEAVMSAMTNEKPVRKGVRQLYEMTRKPMNDALEEVENELRRCVDAHAQLVDYMRQTKPRNKWESELTIRRGGLAAMVCRLLLEESFKRLKKERTHE